MSYRKDIRKRWNHYAPGHARAEISRRMHRLMLRDLSYEAHLGLKTKTENRTVFRDPVKKIKIAPKAQPGM